MIKNIRNFYELCVVMETNTKRLLKYNINIRHRYRTPAAFNYEKQNDL